MKKLLIIFYIMLLTFTAFSQSPVIHQAVSEHYKIYTDESEDYAYYVSGRMEAAIILYNQIFHFDISKLENKFKVTIYSKKETFDKYLQKLLGNAREDFVYIHYSDLKKCELVGFNKPDSQNFEVSLLHQGLIQFIKAFIPHVPLWISEGIAAYIENSTFTQNISLSDSADAALEEKSNPNTTSTIKESIAELMSDTVSADTFKEKTEVSMYKPAKDYSGFYTLNKSLKWLDILKKILLEESDSSTSASTSTSTSASAEAEALSIEELLVIDKNTAIEKINSFYPQAWGFIYFLFNSPKKEYNRILWDSINNLDPLLSLKDNSSVIKDNIFNWINNKTLTSDYQAFILGLKSFNDIVEEGLAYYDNNELEKAKTNFLKAIDIKPSHYFAYYYLGLISYAQKDYYSAEQYYFKAMELGSDEALTYYALGVNSYADNNYDNSLAFLTIAKESDADKYKDKVDIILKRIESETMNTDIFFEMETETDTGIEKETTESSLTDDDHSIDTYKYEETSTDTVYDEHETYSDEEIPYTEFNGGM